MASFLRNWGSSNATKTESPGEQAVTTTPVGDGIDGDNNDSNVFSRAIRSMSQAFAAPGSRGRGDSDAVAAEEAADPAKLQQQTEHMVSKVSEYADIELQGTLSELKLMEQMNQVTGARYAELVSTAEGLQAFSDDLHKRYADLRPVLNEIDELDTAVTELETIVEQFDAYSKRLEAKAQELPPR